MYIYIYIYIYILFIYIYIHNVYILYNTWDLIQCEGDVHL